MLLGGLWHGAGAQFIVWGALHGLALAVHKIFMEFFPSKKIKAQISCGDFSRS